MSALCVLCSGRSLPFVRLLLLLFLCCCLPPGSTSFYLQPTATKNQLLLPNLRYHHQLGLSVPASSSSATPVAAARTQNSYSQDYLEALNVHELRLLIREQNPSQRGLLSKLKRKKDMVTFLLQSPVEKSFPANGGQATVNGSLDDQEEELEKEEETERTIMGVPNVESSSTTRPVRYRRPLQMPRKPSPKEILLDRVRATYPDALEDTVDSAVDFRQTRHPVTANRSQTDMDLVFLGTASCMPGITRGVSCTAVRLKWRRSGASTWIFDVGECSQLQVQRTTAIKPGKISKIFLTHAHGDHTFGLPGLLCLMGQDREQIGSKDVIDIYGPEGLRMWLRVTIRYSVSRIVPPYRVHEIMDIPMAPEWGLNSKIQRFYYKEKGMPGKLQWTRKGLAGTEPLNWISQAKQMDLEPSKVYGEVEGGIDIYPDYNHPACVNGAPVWRIVEEDDVDVYAAPMNHGIPCVGFVVMERSRPGRLRQELVEPIVRRNAESLRAAGFMDPMKAMSIIKNLPIGASFTFPDGAVLKQEDVVEPQKNGRKIVICGDTCDSSALRELAMDADVVVHEATNSYLQGIDPKEVSVATVTRDAIVHGHSTPEIAGVFAESVRAKCLLLNHFSSRYKGDTSVQSLSIMMRIEGLAMAASRMKESQVAAAWDLMVLPVPASNGEATASSIN